MTEVPATQPETCGQGLAENSALPAKLSEVSGFLAGILESHIMALDPSDSRSRDEREAYHKLAREYRYIAARLRAAANQMAGYRDLLMGRHDLKALGDPRTRQAFEAFVRAKHELSALLRETAEADEQILAGMRGA